MLKLKDAICGIAFEVGIASGIWSIIPVHNFQ